MKNLKYKLKLIKLSENYKKKQNKKSINLINIILDLKKHLM